MPVGVCSKKLKDAARFWVASFAQSGKDEVADDLICFGAPSEIVDAYETKDDALEIVSENWEILKAWLSVESQMTRTGIRYTDMKAGLEMSGITITPDLFSGLQIMEAAAIGALNPDE